MTWSDDNLGFCVDSPDFRKEGKESKVAEREGATWSQMMITNQSLFCQQSRGNERKGLDPFDIVYSTTSAPTSKDIKLKFLYLPF